MGLSENGLPKSIGSSSFPHIADWDLAHFQTHRIVPSKKSRKIMKHIKHNHFSRILSF